MTGHGDTIESVHTILMEVSLPASLEDIKNPNEDFIINIISEFFKAFAIDVGTIKRLTMEQLNALEVTGQENAPIAHLINLGEAMGAIGQEIFIKEFNIIDITSPRQVRTKKFLMLIGNFMLYAKNKKAHMQERTNEVLGRVQQIQEYRKEYEEIIEGTNKKARVTQHKIIEIERMKKELIESAKKIEQNKLGIQKNDKLTKERESARAQRIAKNQEKRAELQKRQDLSDQLNARVVGSPDRIRGQLRDLENERKSQEEKREDVQTALLDKKAKVQKYEEGLALVRKEHPKLMEVVDDLKKFNNARKESERIDGEIQEALRTIDLKETLGNSGDQQVATRAIQELEQQCQERLDKLKKIYNDLDAEKRICERKKENLETHNMEINEKNAKLREKIAGIEGEIAEFLKQCHELHVLEMSKRRELLSFIESERKRNM